MAQIRVEFVRQDNGPAYIQYVDSGCYLTRESFEDARLLGLTIVQEEN